MLTACGGSAPDPAPASFVETNLNILSEEDAVARAQSVVADEGLPTDGLEVKPSQLFGEWQISFEPADSDDLRGGFLVVLEAESGVLREVVMYR